MSATSADVLVTRRQAGQVQTEGTREGLIMKELGTTEGWHYDGIGKTVPPADAHKITQVPHLPLLVLLFPVFAHTQKTRLTSSQKLFLCGALYPPQQLFLPWM